MRPVAIYSPRLATFTIVTDAGAFPLPDNRILEIADVLDMLSQACSPIAVITMHLRHDQVLRIPTLDAADLAQGIREAFTIPAHAADLTAKAAS